MGNAMTSGDSQLRMLIAQQAAAWYVANREGLIEGERVAFADWLRASPVHIEEYMGVVQIAKALPMATAKSSETLETLIEQARAAESDAIASIHPGSLIAEPEDPRAKSPRSRSNLLFARFAVAAAGALVFASFLLWRDLQRTEPSATYQTAHGERNAWHLSDGTWVRLNSDSLAVVRYSRSERVVEVRRGEVFFEVAREQRRHFRAIAGTIDAVAIGTQFDVYRRRGDSTVVTVAEGTVGVTIGDGSAGAAAVHVNAGERVQIDGVVLPMETERVDPRVALAWLRGNIVFKERPLSEVAEEFNRYARVPISVEDPQLGALLVSGTFDATDTDSFVAYLETLDGVSVERSASRIRVFSRSAGPGGPAAPRR
jgi:transmembrane sensor